ncbi:hypothetical protein CVIRNUC_007849 [Coccomyxa viridis]|uniref:Uncharacterized protein n=1 Tax=Coccomyxa viridis TaxID=1274662 RepID=A0AAV1IDW8_9CHLO|nr:hypothetical protein CVIRNUC_007849 [Coccomyxa viridis]
MSGPPETHCIWVERKKQLHSAGAPTGGHAQQGHSCGSLGIRADPSVSATTEHQLCNHTVQHLAIGNAMCNWLAEPFSSALLAFRRCRHNRRWPSLAERAASAL